jgi:SOS-response transcriptional repressor LexA
VWLLTGEGPRTAAERRTDEKLPPVTLVPLLDWVSAGRLAESRSQIPVEDVPLLAFADLGPGDWFALTVEGTSMDRVSPNGSKIVVNRMDRELVAGRPYVFWTREGATYKLWRPGDPVYLEPHSWDASNKPIFIKRRKDFEVVGRVRRTLLDL